MSQSSWKVYSVLEAPFTRSPLDLQPFWRVYLHLISVSTCSPHLPRMSLPIESMLIYHWGYAVCRCLLLFVTVHLSPLRMSIPIERKNISAWGKDLIWWRWQWMLWLAYILLRLLKGFLKRKGFLFLMDIYMQKNPAKILAYGWQVPVYLNASVRLLFLPTRCS